MFFRALTITLAMAAACATTTVARANDHIEYYMHNGSLMKMVWDQEIHEYFEMYYERPRDGLSVRKGTWFMGGGEPAGGEVYATAQVFKRGCRPAEYEVTGRFDDAGNLYLSGKAPIRRGCRVVGYASNNNSSLVFTKSRR